MPLKKLQLKSGLNRENTKYTNEGGWYECDKIRFRQGNPEKIGGWRRISSSIFLGICRSLWNWITLDSINIVGVGTSEKFYLEVGGVYNDITPIRSQVTLTNPFETFSGSNEVVVTDASGGYITGDFVQFFGATAVGGLTISGSFKIEVISSSTYKIFTETSATSDATGGGTVYAVYQINVGPESAAPLNGWGAGSWGAGLWGFGQTSLESLRIWSQSNFGEDLIFGHRYGEIFYWDASSGFGSISFTATVASPTVITFGAGYYEGAPIRFFPDTDGVLPSGIEPGKLYYTRNVSGSTFNISATPSGALINTSDAGSGLMFVAGNANLLSDYPGASDVPNLQNQIFVSDISRFVFAMGATEFGGLIFDPMLIRWSDQENPFNWTPASTNQAGFLRLSRGSEIVTSIQSRQEVLVWTDAALYSLQYVGAPIVWSAQIVGENISIVSQNSVAYANGVAYWMGKDKFYKYDGRSQTLPSDLRRYVFQDINTDQYAQIFSGTSEGFNEVWWFYCSKDSIVIDRYVIYNYVENVWYYGNLGRTAWLDSGLGNFPIAATYSRNIVGHEDGVDNNENGEPLPISAFITSAEFDLDDGHNFMFVWRVLPDITFANSTAESPSITMYLLPLKNSGSGYSVNTAVNADHSVATNSSAEIARVAVLPVEQFTGEIFTRVRGRQMAIKIESTDLGVTWQLGSPRIDMRPDGRR